MQSASGTVAHDVIDHSNEDGTAAHTHTHTHTALEHEHGHEHEHEHERASERVDEWDISAQIAVADRETVELKAALADMCHSQGTVYRRLYAAFEDTHTTTTTTTTTTSLVREDTIAHDDDYDESDSEEESESDSECESEEEAHKSFFEKKENKHLMREKAHHFFARAVDHYEDVLESTKKLHQGGDTEHIQHGE